jgi:hypothetical protein
VSGVRTAPEVDRPAIETWRWWWAPEALGLVGAALIWFLLPHDSGLANVGEMLFKILVFLLICGGVAFAPRDLRGSWALAVVPFFVFLGYVLPRISYFGFFVGDILADQQQTGELYTTIYLLLYPGIVFSVALAFRLGGGTPGRTLKISTFGVLLIFSGFLDILWPIANGQPLPATVPAEHIRVVLGHVATYTEAVWFTVAHVPLLVAVLVAPVDRWLERLVR